MVLPDCDRRNLVDHSFSLYNASNIFCWLELEDQWVWQGTPEVVTHPHRSVSQWWSGVVEWSGMERSGVERSREEWIGVECGGVEWSGVEWSGVEWSGVE